MKLTTMITIATMTFAAINSISAFAEGRADTVDYFEGDKYKGSSYYQTVGPKKTEAKGYNADNSSKVTAQYSDNSVAKVSTAIGEVFATDNGQTLYTFTKDDNAASNCYGGCADNWPPFLAKSDAKTWGDFSIIERKDGTHQWAYKDQPLYTWVGDRQQGDTTGHGVGNVWFVAKP